jgi:NAD(P)-dependent dehydrogenase (short-subunit alcohol dehydrogenase family)
MIDTDMLRVAWSEEQIQTYVPSIPLGRMGQPAEVAELVCFLASERAGYITGAALDITGGELMV